MHRFKSDMWAKVAEELAVPWRAAEAMHWQLGEADMARRAGVVPFSLAAVNAEANAARRNSPSRGGHGHGLSQSSMKHGIVPHTNAGSPRIMYGRPQPPMHMSTRSRDAPPPTRRDSFSAQPQVMVQERGEVAYTPIPMLAPIQAQSHPSSERSLPSIAELTTGLGGYGPGPGPGPVSHGGVPTTPYSGPPFIPVMPGYPVHDNARTKRRASTEEAHRQSLNKRRLG